MTDLAAVVQKLDAIVQKLDTAFDVRTNPPVFMTTEEVARFLRVSPERVFQLRKEGTGPRVSGPTNRTIRYHLDDVVAWMKEGA